MRTIMNNNTLDFIGLSMLGMMNDPVIRKMVGAEILTNNTKKDDVIGVALMAKPDYNNTVFNRSI